MEEPTDRLAKEQFLDSILRCFQERGQALYNGEAVTQTEHALQAAHLAETAGADSSLIAAALLHDYGHLTHDLGENCAADGVDDRHEESGARQLDDYFAETVTEPIRLHVAAKRYLCATDSDYLAQLSDASQLSLRLQGGPFTLEEVREFEGDPHYTAAVRLRHWDDQAKVVGLSTPELEHFRQHLSRALK